MTAPQGRHRVPDSAEDLRVRSATIIALTSAIAAAVPTAVLSGSTPLTLMVALGTVVAVSVAGFVI